MRVAFTIAAALATLAFARLAHAEATIDITQDGADVIATLSGEINTSGLTSLGYVSAGGNGVSPVAAIIFMNGDGQLYDLYSGVSGPSSFGSGGTTDATSTTGDTFIYQSPYLQLPYDYVSGTTLSGMQVYAGETLASMGLTTGVYDYTWGSGATADSFQVDIGQAVPEPPSLPLIAAGVVALAFIRRKKAILS